MKFIWDHVLPCILGIVMCYYFLIWRGSTINWFGLILGSVVGNLLFIYYIKPLLP